MSLNLDLTQVKEQSGPGKIPAGEYSIICDDAEIKDTKAGNGTYISVKFRILQGEYEGGYIYNMFNIKNENPTAVNIGLSQLKTFMRCSGVTDFKLTDVLDLVSLKCNAVVKVKTDSYGEKSVISYFKPISESAKPQSKSEFSPF